MAVNKLLIEQFNLEGVRKRLNQINEYIMVEAGEQVPQYDDNEEGQEDQPLEQLPNGQPADGNVDAGQPEQQDAQQDVDDNPEAERQEDEVPSEEQQVDTEPMQPGDEVIDIDDLTDMEEDTNGKVDELKDEIGSLSAVMDKFIDALDSTNRKIEGLKSEMERRNPTDDEKLRMRRNVGTPYHSTMDDYWKENGDRIYNDNMIVPDKKDNKEYEITVGDLNNVPDTEIVDSFGDGRRRLSNYFSWR